MNREEISAYLKEAETTELFNEADKIRKACCGDEIHIRGIIEFSSYCCRSCLYCGLRTENKSISRYRMLPDEIISLSNKIVRDGIKTVVLQSGDDFRYTRQMLSRIIGKIKKKNPLIAITLCVGERPFDDYKAFKDAGADRYLLKHETANPDLYERFHPGQNLKKRLRILEYLKKIDYQTGSGNIVGLPEQTPEDLADDILLLNDLDIDMAGIGPFIPQRDTPLKDISCDGLDLTLKVLAITRILTKNTHLPATTALATLNPRQGQLLGLKAGCNVIMPDFTPERYRKNYVIYDNKARVSLNETIEAVHKLKRKVAENRGDSLKCKKRPKDCVSI